MSVERRLKHAGISLARAIGRYAEWSEAERRIVQAEPLFFHGDLPPMAGAELNQRRVVYAEPRPLITHAAGIVYTNRGMAWQGGRLERRYSFQEIGFRQIWERTRRATKHYGAASILQSQTPCTYGDWVSEHVAALAQASLGKELVEPLLLPSWWLQKPYVKRDLAVLGIRAEAVGSPVLIEQATVVNKTRSSHYWTREEVQAVMAAMNIHPAACHPGTALYLSRKGERSEGPKKRQVDNDVVESAMEQAGVKVVRTAGRTLEEYRLLAPWAETVFADHGSAMYNMMHWQTRRVVELFSPDYWDSSFLFFADALGISDYHLYQIDGSTKVRALTERVEDLSRRRP